ncbi:MAG: hypothetical protein ACK4NO_07160 [Glycocaulis sp.]
MIMTLLAGIALAFAASLLAALLALRAQVLDMPGHRSLHSAPTPRSGGIGVLAGAGAVFLFAAVQPVALPGGPALLALAALMTALGLGDDLFAFSGRAKFAVMAVLCLAFALWIGRPERMGLSDSLIIALPVWLAVPGAALFLFVAINAANFMDGSDGMLAAVLIPAGLGLAAAGLVTDVPVTSLAGIALAGGLAGFLLLNRPPAKVFAGDAGSLGAGALYGGGALAMAGEGFAGSLWLAPLFILPFLADVLLTLAKRAAGGRLSLNAHREHAYQLLILSGWSHGRVALAYSGGALACVLAGLAAAQGPGWAGFAAFLAMTGLMSALYALIHRLVPDRP